MLSQVLIALFLMAGILAICTLTFRFHRREIVNLETEFAESHWSTAQPVEHGSGLRIIRCQGFDPAMEYRGHHSRAVR
jgi:hypothetical protein